MAKVIRNLRTSEKNGNTYVYIESNVAEQAFEVGERFSIELGTDFLKLNSDPNGKYKTSKKKRAGWSVERPIIDICNREISTVLKAKESIDIIIEDGVITIRHEQSFSLVVINENEKEVTTLDEKITLFSLPSGGGMATASLVDTGYFESVGGADIDEVSIATYLQNFKKGDIFWGDIRRMHTDYIPEAQVCWLSPPCTDFSNMGAMGMGVTEGLGMHFARMVYGSGAEVVFIEQVPNYFKSRSYVHLKKILTTVGFGNWSEAIIDAYDLGSISSRKRGYAIGSKRALDFSWPSIPNIPQHKRKTINQILDKKWEGDWRDIKGSTMEHFMNRTSSTHNFTTDKSRTLVDLNDKRVSAFTCTYSKINISNSYLKHPDKEQWRMFTPQEMQKMMNIPDWFEFPKGLLPKEAYRLLGQSVDGLVVKALGIELAYSLLRHHLGKAKNIVKRMTKQLVIPTITKKTEQICLF